ncbi:MAG: hypothetical protein IJ334_01560 [Clostridia bacterium]|nr:hypothetical protein [Clostridia bacterium]
MPAPMIVTIAMIFILSFVFILFFVILIIKFDSPQRWSFFSCAEGVQEDLSKPSWRSPRPTNLTVLGISLMPAARTTEAVIDSERKQAWTSLISLWVSALPAARQICFGHRQTRSSGETVSYFLFILSSFFFIL